MPENPRKIKCVLHGYGTCSGRISSEHYISAALLRQIRGDGKIYIEGVAWALNKPTSVGQANLTANILCTNHNSRLSELDALAGRIFGDIKKAQLELKEKSRKSSMHTYCGLKFERWLIKVLIMMWSSGNLVSNGVKLSGAPPQQWKNYLLGLEELPLGWGLYVKPVDGPFATADGEFELMTLSGQDGSGVKAVHFKLCRLPFTLILGKPDGDWGFWRPSEFVLKNNAAVHKFRFRWPGESAGPSIVYERIGDAP